MRCASRRSAAGSRAGCAVERGAHWDRAGAARSAARRPSGAHPAPTRRARWSRRGRRRGRDRGRTRAARRRGPRTASQPASRSLSRNGRRARRRARARRRGQVPAAPRDRRRRGAAGGSRCCLSASSVSEFASYGKTPGEQLVGDDAERVEIRRGTGLLAAPLLGREVRRGAEHGADLGDARLVGCAGDAEVRELDDAVVGAQQVAWLYVAMDDAVAVGVVEPGAGAGRRRRARSSRSSRRARAGSRRRTARRRTP